MTTLLSCQTEKTDHFVSLNDSLKNVISNYVESNNLDIKTKVISIRYSIGEERTDIYITNINNEIYKERDFTPYFYSVLDNGTVVLVYTGFESIFFYDASGIENEITDLIDQYGVKLEGSTESFYYAPTWKYSQCFGSASLSKKMDPLEYDFIPCGYRLIQDTTKTDSLFLVKTGQ